MNDHNQTEVMFLIIIHQVSLSHAALLRLDSYNSGQESCPSPIPSQVT